MKLILIYTKNDLFIYFAMSHPVTFLMCPYRKSIDTWNYFTKQLKENLSGLSRDQLKTLITEQFFES